jgi:hypothetical protein
MVVAEIGDRYEPQESTCQLASLLLNRVSRVIRRASERMREAAE